MENSKIVSIEEITSSSKEELFSESEEEEESSQEDTSEAEQDSRPQSPVSVDNSFSSSDKLQTKDDVKKEKKRLDEEKVLLKKKKKEIDKQQTQEAKQKKKEIKLKKEQYKKEKKKSKNLNKEPEVEDIYSGFLKYRGPLKNWHRRWFVLRPGMLIYFKDKPGKTKKKQKCNGMILLHGTEVKERPTKKDGFCLKIFHPHQHPIWSSKGLSGESIKNNKASHYILLLSEDKETIDCWIDKVQQAISKPILGGDKESREQEMEEDISYEDSEYDSDYDSDNKRGSGDSHELKTESPSKNDTNSENISSTEKSKKRLSASSPIVTDISPAKKRLSASLPVNDPGNGEKRIKSVPKLDSKNLRKIAAKNAVKEVNSIIHPTEYSVECHVKDNLDASLEEELGENSTGVLSTLIKQVKPGMDLSRVVLPTFILENRSMLEKLTDFFVHGELMSKVTEQPDPLNRLIALVKWYVSGFYIKPPGVKKPYNPILGETFRCIWNHPEDGARTFYVAEQVTHHPPTSAFYGANRKNGFAMNGSITFKSKFLGTSAQSILDGSCTIHLLDHNEEWEVTFPNYSVKGIIFGTMTMELISEITIKSKQHDLSAKLEFKTKPFFGGEYNCMQGKILQGKTSLYTVSGKWDEKLELKNSKTKDVEVLWEPTPEIRASRMPKLKIPLDQQGEFESEKLWYKVTKAIDESDGVTATNEKADLEEAQRQAKTERDENGIDWEPKLFELIDDKWVYKHQNLTSYDNNEPETYEIDGIITNKPLENWKPEDLPLIQEKTVKTKKNSPKVELPNDIKKKRPRSSSSGDSLQDSKFRNNNNNNYNDREELELFKKQVFEKIDNLEKKIQKQQPNLEKKKKIILPVSTVNLDLHKTEL